MDPGLAGFQRERFAVFENEANRTEAVGRVFHRPAPRRPVHVVAQPVAEDDRRTAVDKVQDRLEPVAHPLGIMKQQDDVLEGKLTFGQRVGRRQDFRVPN